MKTLLVKLDIGKPLSDNDRLIPVVRGRYARLINNQEAKWKAYRALLSAELRKYFVHFQALGQTWDEKRHAIEVIWYVYVPEKEFFTQKGTISKTCLDVSNTVKTLNDHLKDILGVDDSQFVCSTTRKIPSDSSWCVVLELSIVQRPEVVRLSEQRSLPAFE